MTNATKMPEAQKRLMGLQGVRVAVPESRELDQFSVMLENRGASVYQVPLVAIHDTPDQAPVVAWLERFITRPPDMFILLTGEGLRRLLAASERQQNTEQFLTVLRGTTKLCRGPKPVKVLQTLGMAVDIPATTPTTEGVIATLAADYLKGRRVAVQLYGEDPNVQLVDFLRKAGAEADVVAPYVYASKEEAVKVVNFISALAQGKLDVVAFTSQSQFKRLQQVASESRLETELRQGLDKVVLAAVGPVVRQQLEQAGYRVEIMPERVYFMLPLVAAIAKYYEGLDNSGSALT